MNLLLGPADSITAGAALLANSYAGWLADARRGLYPFIKRSLDISISGVALMLLSPLLLIAAVLVRLESPGPVLFSQIRIGRRGRSFRCWKIRSMYIDAEVRKAALMAGNEMLGGTTFKMKRDPRITRIGRFIRKASIDELPQLWNVLAGEMSLVGPRPPVPSEVAQYNAMDRLRLSVKPGITCIWQVSGRSDIPFEEQVRLDVRYIQERSLWLDIRLLLATVPAVLFARGAY
jgi:exopolysaccharide biosynthesis polyprenyl glycosylphosphotransferase